MTTVHENVVLALETALGAHTAEVLRERDLPATCPPEGLVNLVPGDPVEDGVRLGTGIREWRREIELEHLVTDRQAVTRNTLLDALLATTGQVLSGSTLGGAVDYLHLGPPQDADDVPMAGAETIRGAVVTVTLFYETSDNPMETLP